MKNEQSEQHIKKLFKTHGTVKPHKDFTSQVMQSIESVSPEKVSDMREKKWDGMILATAGALAFGGLLYFFIFGNGVHIWGEYDPIMLPVMKNIWISLKEIITSFKISSVTIVILAGIISILTAERVLRKIQSGKSTIHLV